MTAKTFLGWRKTIFLLSLPSACPVIFLLDGNKSHIGYEVRQIAKENGVYLLKLPPHTTHLLQPLDLDVFNHLKHTWEPIVGQFTRQQVKFIKKADFPKLLTKMWLSLKPDGWLLGLKWLEFFLSTTRVPKNTYPVRTEHTAITAHTQCSCWCSVLHTPVYLA